MIPPHQCLDALHAAVGVHQRLVVEPELTALETRPDTLLELPLLYRLCVEVGSVERELALPGLLGAVHRKVGSLCELLHRRPVARSQCDADTHPDRHVGAAAGILRQLVGTADGGEELVRHEGRITRVMNVAEDHHELIATKAVDRIRLTQRIAEPPRGFDQEVVTGFMSECVVDLFEPVEIEEHHRGIPGLGNCEIVQNVAHIGIEQIAVPESRQLIMVGKVPQSPLGILAPRDIADDARERSPAVFLRVSEGNLHGRNSPVLVLSEELDRILEAQPASILVVDNEVLAKCRLVALVLSRRKEHPKRLTANLFRPIAECRLDRRICVDDGEALVQANDGLGYGLRERIVVVLAFTQFLEEAAMHREIAHHHDDAGLFALVIGAQQRLDGKIAAVVMAGTKQHDVVRRRHAGYRTRGRDLPHVGE